MYFSKYVTKIYTSLKYVLIAKTFVFEPVLLLGLHYGSFGYGKRICKHLVHEGAGQINYHPKQNERTVRDSNIMQLVHCACIFSGQVNVLQYTVAGAATILFSLQCDNMFLALCLGSRNSLTFKMNWQK